MTSSRIWIAVGADFGDEICRIARADPCVRIYAFEPDLRLALQRTGALPNLTVIPMAVGDCDGALDLYPIAHNAPKPGLIRLDWFLETVGIAEVAFLTVHTKGVGLSVIRSAGNRLRDVGRISLYASPGSDSGDAAVSERDAILEHLIAEGFALQSVEKQADAHQEKLNFCFEPLLRKAQALTYVRPLAPYPGWRFDAGWDNPDVTFRMRREIWTHFRAAEVEMPFLMKWHDGLRVILYLGNDASRQVFIGGCSEPNEFAFLDGILAPGMVFVDAGAHEGLYTLFAAMRVGARGLVWAFEPSAREFGRLNRNVRINGLRQIRTFPVALAEYDGTAELRIADAEHSGQNTLGDFVHQNIGLLGQESVAVRTLDSLVAQENLQRLDVMKLDVEGAEGRLLQGARNVLATMRPIILLECLEAALQEQGTTVDSLIDFLSSFNYLLYSYDATTGLPIRAQLGQFTANMVAVPAERPLKD